MGNAVKRNRAKRILRAHFIENYHLLHQGSYVLVAKPPLLGELYTKVKLDYQNALKKVHKV
jgi:ribonuclease P protein component